MKKIRNFALVLASLIFAVIIGLLISSSQATPLTDYQSGIPRVTVINELLVTTDTLGINGGTGALQVTGNLYTNNGVYRTAYDIEITSASATFSAANKSVITLTSNANTTGIVPTGGVAGQEITIISGSGSNTLRFDDGANMNLGGNITLTEAQFDVLTLRSIDGTNWVRLYSADN